MNLPCRTTLTQFLIEERRRYSHASGDFNSLILQVALACKSIARQVALGALGACEDGGGGAVNVQGETQHRLDVAGNRSFIALNEWGGNLAGMVSEEMDGPYRIPERYPRGKYLLLFDPLDGSSNIDVNVAVGSIFSVLRAPGGAAAPASEADFLQPGSAQVAAGYAIYGPATMLVLSVGTGVHGFTLDAALGEFMLTHPALAIPAQAREFAINAANSRFWEAPVKRYVDECLAGRSGVRGKDFNMRWIASLVAEAHRILMRGGVFLYPCDSRHADMGGRLRLLYEANPVRFLVEQAGGRASTGRQPVLGWCRPRCTSASAWCSARARKSTASSATTTTPGPTCPRRCSTSTACSGHRPEGAAMSERHPIIAITGSSGAGTTSVSRTFDCIFRRERIRAVIVEGDSFHRYDREEMKARLAAAELAGDTSFSHFGPENNLFEDLEALFADYARDGTGRCRKYLHDIEDAARHRRGAPPGPPDRRGPGDQPRMDTETVARQGQARLFDRSRHRHHPAPHARLREPHLPAVLAHPRQLPARALRRYLEPLHRARHPGAGRKLRGDPLRRSERHRLPVPAGHGARRLHVAREHHRRPRREDGTGDAADLHPLHPAHDGAPQARPERRLMRPHMATPDMPAVDALLVDLDGTLVDTAPDIFDAALRTLRELGTPPLPFDTVRGFIGNGVPALVRRVLRASGNKGLDERRALALFHHHYRATNGRASSVFPGVREGLHALRQAGRRLACVTNKPHAATAELLEIHALAAWFDVVVAGDTLERMKPDPAPLPHACERLGAQPGRTLLVGDSGVDVAAARAARMPAAIVRYGYPGMDGIDLTQCDALIDSLEELPARLAAPGRS